MNMRSWLQWGSHWVLLPRMLGSSWRDSFFGYPAHYLMYNLTLDYFFSLSILLKFRIVLSYWGMTLSEGHTKNCTWFLGTSVFSSLQPQCWNILNRVRNWDILNLLFSHVVLLTSMCMGILLCDWQCKHLEMDLEKTLNAAEAAQQELLAITCENDLTVKNLKESLQRVE